MCAWPYSVGKGNKLYSLGWGSNYRWIKETKYIHFVYEFNFGQRGFICLSKKGFENRLAGNIYIAVNGFDWSIENHLFYIWCCWSNQSICHHFFSVCQHFSISATWKKKWLIFFFYLKSVSKEVCRNGLAENYSSNKMNDFSSLKISWNVIKLTFHGTAISSILTIFSVFLYVNREYKSFRK